MAGVTAVVCAAFDPGSDEQLDALRVGAARRGLRVRLGHRPHVTLGAARVLPGPDLDALVGVVGALAGRHTAFGLDLCQVGSFATTGVVWVGPREDDRRTPLLLLQRDADTALQDAGWPRAFGWQSDPDGWVPHCTIATRVPSDRIDSVRSDLCAAAHPITARVEALAVIVVGGEGDVAHVQLPG